MYFLYLEQPLYSIFCYGLAFIASPMIGRQLSSGRSYLSQTITYMDRLDDLNVVLRSFVRQQTSGVPALYISLEEPGFSNQVSLSIES